MMTKRVSAREVLVWPSLTIRCSIIVVNTCYEGGGANTQEDQAFNVRHQKYQRT